MSEKTSDTLLTGHNAILARRYAEALFELASDENALDAVAEELQALKRLQHESADFRELICSPRLSRPAGMEMMKKISSNANFSKLTSNFLGLLAKNRRMRFLSGMAEIYLDMLARSRGEFRVEVRVARPLETSQEQALVAQLQKVTGGDVRLDVRLDPALLGGLIVKIGSRQIDASLRGKLARLERQLKTQQEAA